MARGMQLRSQSFRSLTSSLGTPSFRPLKPSLNFLTSRRPWVLFDALLDAQECRLLCSRYEGDDDCAPGGCASRKTFGIFHDCVEYPRRLDRRRRGTACWQYLACRIWHG